MSKRALAAVLVFMLTLSGCSIHKVQRVPLASVPHPEKEMVVGITTLKGDDVSFDPPGAKIAENTLSGSVKKSPYTIPMADVQRLWVERKEASTARTVGLVAAVAVGTVLVIAAVVAATKQSCPFVYSWNGSKYVFDAEPYGGAIAQGLEKDDYSELGQLREENGVYKIRVTNEVDETQMTNLTELWVVDHPSGTRVIPDIQGKLHTISSPYAPLTARDASGNDLLPWLRATDRLIWEPSSVPDANGGLQGEITMTFPKPEGASEVKLIANAATGLWGSYMIKKMVELRGREVNNWYKTINESKEARDALFAWEVREQLYALKIYVEEPTGWNVRGILPGTGPFISKDRIVPLDLSHVPGNQVRIRIQPPAGFWALNSFAVDYSKDAPLSVRTVTPSAAQEPGGKDVLPELTSVDDRYLEMPNIGDTADVTFHAPASTPHTKRTVFLHSRGFYKLHILQNGNPDAKTLEAIENVPGAAARFAAEGFSQWQVASR